MGEIGKREDVDPSGFYGNGSVLEAKRTLASYNIQKHSTIMLGFASADPDHCMKIEYQFRATATRAVKVKATDTVAMLMANIGRHEGVDSSGFYLFGKGSVLEEQRTLASYDIRAADTVAVVFRMLVNVHSAVPNTGVLFPINVRVPGAGYSRVIDALGSIPFQQRDFEVILSRPCVGKVVLRKKDSDKAGFMPSAPEATLTVIFPGCRPRSCKFDPLSGMSADEVIQNLRAAVLPCVPADYRRRGFDVYLTPPSGAQVLLDGAAVLASLLHATTTVHVRSKEPEGALGCSATPVEKCTRMQLYYRRSTNETRAVNMEASDTVAMLMAKIGEREGVDPSAFHLIGKGARLLEERTLASYNIRAADTVTMLFRLFGNGHSAVLDAFPIKINARRDDYSQVTGSLPFQQRDFEVFLSRPCVGQVVLRKKDSDKAGFTPSTPEATLTVILPGFPPQTCKFDPLSGTSADEVIQNLRAAVLPCVPAELQRRGFDVFLTRPSGAQVLLDGAAELASPHATTVHVGPEEPKVALGRSATPVTTTRVQLSYYRSIPESRAFDMEAADSVTVLMEKIEKREGVDPSSFYLIFSGGRLKKERPLASLSSTRPRPRSAPLSATTRQAPPVPSTRPCCTPVSAATRAAPTLSTVGTNTLNTSDVGTQCDPDEAAVAPPPRVRPPQRFKIFYRRLTSDARAVEVSPTDTVAGLTTRIAALEGHNAASFHLAADGSVMADPERTLASYNVQDGTTVTMLFRMAEHPSV